MFKHPTTKAVLISAFIAGIAVYHTGTFVSLLGLRSGDQRALAAGEDKEQHYCCTNYSDKWVKEKFCRPTDNDQFSIMNGHEGFACDPKSYLGEAEDCLGICPRPFKPYVCCVKQDDGSGIYKGECRESNYRVSYDTQCKADIYTTDKPFTSFNTWDECKMSCQGKSHKKILRDW